MRTDEGCVQELLIPAVLYVEESVNSPTGLSRIIVSRSTSTSLSPKVGPRAVAPQLPLLGKLTE